MIPSPTVSHSTVSPWINLTRCPTSSYTPSILENGSRLPSSTSTCSHLPSASSSSTSQQIIDISDSENDDCVIIDEVRNTPQTIVLDDSDAEIPNSRIAPRSPVPSTSGYRPPMKTSTDDKNLPSTSNYDFKFGIGSLNSENCCSLSCFKNYPRKRSPSDSSVISTDNSVINSEPNVKPEPKEKKRKRKTKKADSCRESFDLYLSSSEFSYNCDDDNDSDWEANPKKKKKPKKHSNKSDKKTHKRKKVARSKSPKRDKCADTENTHKSKHASKSHKSKKSSKSIVDSNSNSSAAKSVVSLVSNMSSHDNNFSPIRPKLRSVVKKVERNSHDDNLPSTSYGFRCSGENQIQSFVRRSFYSSDSD